MKQPQKTLKVNMQSMKLQNIPYHKRGYSTEQHNNP